jgi:pyruvate dehydrogenase complex dehydrogenase (E1) component
VLLVKTVKGFGMGKSGEGKNTAHQTKKLVDEDVHAFRDRWNIPIPDDKLGDIPFYKPADDTPEMKYLQERRKALGGYLPHRRTKADEQLAVPPLDTFKAVLEPTTEGREISTTQAFVRFLTQLLRDKDLGPRRCRSSSTRRAPSAWRACSGRSASTTRRARTTPRSIATRSCTTARTRPARCCRKASTSRAA